MQPGFTLAPRDPFADAKETLSSWDNCMAKDYCKSVESCPAASPVAYAV
jgi:hypothetical protein